ncbi:hypothetical protein Hanom_Chr02g00162101 [Helianthus anomalus]
MAEPSNPLSTTVENHEPSSPVATEEEDEPEVNAPGMNLPVLRWTESAFQTLLTSTQMPPEYGATYPQEGDTAGDAPAGYVTMFADFFGDCSLRLSLTVFVLEVLEYYKLYISQLSPFWRFYQLSVQLGFFSFRQRDHAPKLMFPPKGMTKWKTKFFYVKAATIIAKLQFRNVMGTTITENISIPKADTVDWQLWVLRMMIGRMSRKARPVLREKNGDGLEEEAPLWRMFCPDFEGKVDIVKCGADEEGWNRTIVGNFRMPDEAALNAVLPGGKGDLALGDPAATGVPKQTVLKFSDKRQRKMKMHEAVSVSSLVQEATGASTGASRSTVGTKPVDDKKRKAAVVAETREEPVSLFVAPHSSPKVVDVKVQKKGGESPSIEVVSGGGTPPSVHAEETLKKTAGETIVDTLDSSNNLIDL